MTMFQRATILIVKSLGWHLRLHRLYTHQTQTHTCPLPEIAVNSHPPDCGLSHLSVGARVKHRQSPMIRLRRSALFAATWLIRFNQWKVQIVARISLVPVVSVSAGKHMNTPRSTPRIRHNRVMVKRNAHHSHLARLCRQDNDLANTAF